jgi:hypothetical protein
VRSDWLRGQPVCGEQSVSKYRHAVQGKFTARDEYCLSDGLGSQEKRGTLRLIANQFGVFLTVNQSLKHHQNLALSSLKFIILVTANSQYDSIGPLIPQVKVALTKLASGNVRGFLNSVVVDDSINYLINSLSASEL